MVRENGKTMADAEGDVLRGLRKFIKNIYIYKANYIYYCNPSYFQISTNALNTDTHTQTRARTMILVRPPPLRIAAIQEP